MKKIAIILLLSILPLAASAKHDKFRPENLSSEELTQMQARDIAMWLNLQGETKDRFISDYTSFRKEIAVVAKGTVRPESAETEDDIERAITNNFEVSEKILLLRKTYYLKFREYLQPSQIRLMYHLENEAGRRMFEGRPSPGGPGMPGGPGQPEAPCGGEPAPDLRK